MSQYDTDLALQRNESLDSSASYASSDDRYFTSSNATYCEDNDSPCQACLKIKSQALEDDSVFCTGTNGCVCLNACEFSGWATIAVALLPTALPNNRTASYNCTVVESLAVDAGAASDSSTTSAPSPSGKAEPTTSGSDSGETSGSSSVFYVDLPLGIIGLVLGGGILLLLALIVYFTRRNERRFRRRRSAMRSRERTSTPLELPAWKAMRDELIANEQPVVTSTGRLSQLGSLSPAQDVDQVEVRVAPAMEDPILAARISS